LQIARFEVEIKGKGERRAQRKGHFMDFFNMFNVCIACTSNKKAKEMHQFFCLKCKWEKKTQEIENLHNCPMSTQKILYKINES
jgi:hypothetical protein